MQKIYCYVVSYLFEKGLGYVEAYTKEKEDEIEAFVKGVVPGEAFDEAAWDAVKGLIPHAFELAHQGLKALEEKMGCPV